MFLDVSEELIQAVATNEFRKFAYKHSDEWKDLAADYAVQMIEEIRNILSEKISPIEMNKKIMNVVLFLDPPPYPKRTQNPFPTSK